MLLRGPDGHSFVAPLARGDAVLLASDVTEHYWLPDGERVVYVTSGGVHVVRRDGTERLRIADPLPDSGARAHVPSPDGRWIALWHLSETGGRRALCTVTIVLAATDGSEQIPLGWSRGEGHCLAPAFSADGRFLAFADSSLADPAAGAALTVFDIALAERVVALRLDPAAEPAAFAWHPTANLLAHLETDGDRTALRVLDAETGAQSELGDASGRTRPWPDRLGWDARGELIVFCTDDGLWRGDPEAGAVHRLGHREFCGEHQLSPGGHWASTQHDVESSVIDVVRIVPVRGTHALELEAVEQIGWTQDGSRFVYRAGTSRDGLIAVSPTGEDAVRFEDIHDETRFHRPWPDVVLAQDEQSLRPGSGIDLLDLRTGGREHHVHHELIESSPRPRQRAFCARATVGAEVRYEDDDEVYSALDGTGSDRLVVFWQDAPGEPWQQHVLDERPYPASGECFIP
jgi:hypothetical protein